MYFLFNKTTFQVFVTYLTGALYVHPLWFYEHQRNNWVRSTQNAFSLPFAAVLVNCAPSGEMHNYCTPHIIKENCENFVIHRCNYILLSQVYCVWQVVKTPTIILNNSVDEGERSASRLGRFIPGWPRLKPETPWNRVDLDKIKSAVWTCKLLPNFTKTH
jgi:hypothetical protein